ncbi:PREDICTED: protein FAM177A1 [Dufourea novaeangliae]|uniref:protein FAM177A1 n=1 Tax=Dufourea novaeangliae TaxID=178035 RepID=UPI0007678008|nr:PREDICTED: protein FAM177A1 [Dufourea novaeangliae]
MDPEKNDVCHLSDVVLNENSSSVTQGLKPKKRPKRVLHFSDGDLEEYSEDETDSPEEMKAVTQMDPKSLDWAPWAWYQTTWLGSKVLDGCDYAGEWLASFFGITAPKYQFEINEFYRLQALENDIQRKQDLEMGGWNEQNKNNLINDNNVQ